MISPKFQLNEKFTYLLKKLDYTFNDLKKSLLFSKSAFSANEKICQLKNLPILNSNRWNGKLNLSSSDQALSGNVNNSIKMPTSLSQINSSLTINSMQYPVSNNVPNQSVRRSSSSQLQPNSSNTIRNLLALNSPALSGIPASISPPKQTSNSMRISDNMSNVLNSNSQNSSIVIVPSEAKTKADSLSISNLLNSNIIVSQHTEAPMSQTMSQEQFMDQVKPPPSKRGRKNVESGNSRSNSKTKSATTSKTRAEESVQSTQLNTLIIADSIEGLSSSSPSPSQKFSNFNSFSLQNQSFASTDSNYGDYTPKYKSGPYAKQQEMSYPSKLNRSDSLNSVNTDSANLSTAEQKRRCNIQQGFDRLQILVPALKDGKSLKVSKAVMLQKTSEYIKELQLARQKRVSDLEVFKREIDELSDKIAECQNELPVSGVSVVGNLNKTEIFEQKFYAHAKDKAMVNWKFYLFSLILKPLFDSFIQTVNTSCKEDMERTFQEWQAKFCSLAQLRPLASNALRTLSRNTSVLTEPAKLPEECITAALSQV
ncbi:MLX-interacting -like isoform X2 [Brachionus plicatilis]|uniref:MLX-interacting-like isoform X2 n=1 Tax=Brachionus plicatilis TaxID=10195 RepID=A0A3M7P962_BRAPC|nr:MLX-interacting -like isoform X2 [Brachionus plicatilis]